MLRLAFVASAAATLGAQAVDPAFPGAALEGAGKISDVVSKATASAAYAKGSSGGDSGNESALLSQLISRAKNNLVEQIVENSAQSDLASSAYLMVHERMLKQIFVGGCPRDYAGCPIGWTSGSDGTCAPGADYDGYCGAAKLGGLSTAQLEDFAWRCRAQWSCEASCARDFSQCPSGFTASGSGCVANQSYAGPCSPTTNFSGMDDAAKASWAAMCGTSFPCAGSSGAGSQRESGGASSAGASGAGGPISA